MTDSEFKAKLKSGLSGAYLFFGPEDYMKKYYLSELRRSYASDAGAAFNHYILNADESTFSFERLNEALSSAPFFSDKKLIELHGIVPQDMNKSETDELTSALSGMSGDSVNILIIYTLSSEYDYTDKKVSALHAALTALAEPVDFEYQQQNRLEKWMIRHFGSHSINVKPQVCAAIIACCGRQMHVLSSEIAKLSAYAAASGRNEVTSEDVTLLCPVVRELGAFDFSNAVLAGDSGRMLELFKEQKLRREKPELLLSGITTVYNYMYTIKIMADGGLSQREIAQKLKLNEYRVKLYSKAAAGYSEKQLFLSVRYCAEADCTVKYSDTDAYVAVETLICALAEVKRSGEKCG